MSETDAILERFIADWTAGLRPDPGEAVASVADATEQAELARAIELFLEVAPTPDFSSDQLTELRSAPEATGAGHAFSSALTALDLERARESRGLSLREVAHRVLAAAGIASTDDHEAKLEERLAQAESGEVPVERWTDRARAALSTALGSIVPPAPASPGVLLRAPGAPAENAAERIDFVADALDASIRQAADTDHPVDRFLFGAGGLTE